ncbi:MAG: hypothetical protein M3Z31_01660 [Pseudomonadota bacterium]|nr:hypothetical protein [Pseudomonadota bacterium]
MDRAYLALSRTGSVIALLLDGAAPGRAPVGPVVPIGAVPLPLIDDVPLPPIGAVPLPMGDVVLPMLEPVVPLP